MQFDVILEVGEAAMLQLPGVLIPCAFHSSLQHSKVALLTSLFSLHVLNPYSTIDLVTVYQKRGAASPHRYKIISILKISYPQPA